MTTPEPWRARPSVAAERASSTASARRPTTEALARCSARDCASMVDAASAARRGGAARPGASSRASRRQRDSRRVHGRPPAASIDRGHHRTTAAASVRAGLAAVQRSAPAPAGRTAPGRASSGSSGSRRACRRGARSGRCRCGPYRPSTSSSTPKTMTKVRAFIGIGGNSGMMMRFGNSMPKASSRPNSAPDAPTVGHDRAASAR